MVVQVWGPEFKSSVPMEIPDTAAYTCALAAVGIRDRKLADSKFSERKWETLSQGKEVGHDTAAPQTLPSGIH